MNHEVFIKPRAELDLFEAFKFYDEQSSGLGNEFIRCVDAKLEFIVRNPNPNGSEKTVVARRALPLQSLFKFPVH